MEGILQLLHDCEINGTITWFYDGQWTVAIGDLTHGIRATAVVTSELEAYFWLDRKAQELYPHYAKRRAN